MKSENGRKLAHSFREGFVMGADPLGLMYSLYSQNETSLGYQALQRHSESINLRVHAGSQLTMIAGTVMGLTANVITLGLLETMMLSEAYCLDKNSKDNS